MPAVHGEGPGGRGSTGSSFSLPKELASNAHLEAPLCGDVSTPSSLSSACGFPALAPGWRWVRFAPLPTTPPWGRDVSCPQCLQQQPRHTAELGQAARQSGGSHSPEPGARPSNRAATSHFLLPYAFPRETTPKNPLGRYVPTPHTQTSQAAGDRLHVRAIISSAFWVLHPPGKGPKLLGPAEVCILHAPVSRQSLFLERGKELAGHQTPPTHSSEWGTVRVGREAEDVWGSLGCSPPQLDCQGHLRCSLSVLGISL